jgi:hypothetical protein
VGSACVTTDQSAATDRRPDFIAWLKHWSSPGFIGYRHEQWYAIAPDFCIAGMGRTPYDAFHDLMTMVDSYLHSEYERGHSYEQARRPLGRITTLRLLLPLKHRKRFNLFPTTLH